MKIYRPVAPRPRAEPLRIPAFHPVPGRGRHDGWTPMRQAEFIGHLAETRSVSAAARRVSMARETAYRLRDRPWAESFCTAWDAAQRRKPQPRETFPRKVTIEELRWRIECGIWQVRFKAGRYAGAWHKPDDSALLSLLARLDRGGKARPAE